MPTILIQLDDSDVLSSRETGLSFRVAIEKALQVHDDEVILDFSHIRNANHSCIDEMIGVLVFRNGPDVLKRLVFNRCSPVVRTMIEFVIADRLETRQKV